MKKRYTVDRHGTETEIKGHKHRLRNQPGLQHLPSEVIATDEDDPDKVSVYDAPHIQRELVEEHYKALDKPTKKPSRFPPIAQPGEVVPLNQFQVDIVRLRICKALTDVHMAEQREGKFKGIPSRHVWFPEDNVNSYELRDGNPPSDTDRPKHLRRYKLALDPVTITKTESFKEIINDQAAAGTFSMGA